MTGLWPVAAVASAKRELIVVAAPAAKKVSAHSMVRFFLGYDALNRGRQFQD
jgi:hypothetical protein